MVYKDNFITKRQGFQGKKVVFGFVFFSSYSDTLDRAGHSAYKFLKKVYMTHTKTRTAILRA